MSFLGLKFRKEPTLDGILSPDMPGDASGLEIRDVDRDAASLTELSAMTLERAGTVVDGNLTPTVEQAGQTRPATITDRLKEGEGITYVPGTQAPDFMKHMFSGSGDNRIQRVIAGRRQQMSRLRPRSPRPTRPAAT